MVQEDFRNSWNQEVQVRFCVLEPLTALAFVALMKVGLAFDPFSFSKVHYYYFYWRSRGISICQVFKDFGFDHVRMRVSVDVVNNMKALKEIREVVDDCRRTGLIVIISYNARELRENPSSASISHFLSRLLFRCTIGPRALHYLSAFR